MRKTPGERGAGSPGIHACRARVLACARTSVSEVDVLFAQRVNVGAHADARQQIGGCSMPWIYALERRPSSRAAHGSCRVRPGCRDVLI